MKEKGTFRDHWMKMVKKHILWTTHLIPTKIVEVIKDNTFLSCDTLMMKLVKDNENEKIFCLSFDFGDIAVEYNVTFTKPEGKKRWVCSKIE